jgi:hypothetical protein
MYHNILYNEAIKKIETKDTEQVLEGIKGLRESGKPSAVEVVVDVLREFSDEKVQKECACFLNDIKDPQAAGLIVAAMKNPQNKGVLHYIVSSAWQNDLDYSIYLSDFVKVLLFADYLSAFEAFTVIENHLEKTNPETMRLIFNEINQQMDGVQNEKLPMIEGLLSVLKSV